MTRRRDRTTPSKQREGGNGGVIGAGEGREGGGNLEVFLGVLRERGRLVASEGEGLWLMVGLLGSLGLVVVLLVLLLRMLGLLLVLGLGRRMGLRRGVLLMGLGRGLWLVGVRGIVKLGITNIVGAGIGVDVGVSGGRSGVQIHLKMAWWCGWWRIVVMRVVVMDIGGGVSSRKGFAVLIRRIEVVVVVGGGGGVVVVVDSVVNVVGIDGIVVGIDGIALRRDRIVITGSGRRSCGVVVHANRVMAPRRRRIQMRKQNSTAIEVIPPSWGAGRHSERSRSSHHIWLKVEGKRRIAFEIKITKIKRGPSSLVKKKEDEWK